MPPTSIVRSRTRLALALAFALGLSLFGQGCGYVGDPLPPALHIPERVTDLSVIQKDAQIVAQFTLPARTTENLEIRKPVAIELSAAPAVTPFRMEVWEASAKVFNNISSSERSVRYAFPAAEWVGKDINIGVRVSAANGRTAGWSNLFTLSVVPPLAKPTKVRAEDVRDGVRLTWQGSAPHYRVFRRAGEETGESAVGESDASVYTDLHSEYGMAYHYSIEAFRTGGDVHAISDRSDEVTITTKDTWPPPVPATLVAVAATGSIELTWDRSIAPDLAGYHIYRAEGQNALEKIGEARETPSYSDRGVQSGKTYRYAVTSFDALGNESEKSTPVTVTAP